MHAAQLRAAQKFHSLALVSLLGDEVPRVQLPDNQVRPHRHHATPSGDTRSATPWVPLLGPFVPICRDVCLIQPM